MNQAMQVIKYLCTGISNIYNPIPQTIFTKPQIACLEIEGFDYDNRAVAEGQIPYSSVGYSHVIDEAEGYFKIIRDIESDTIVKAEIVGDHACELIHTYAPYINKGIDVHAFEDIVFAHPTLSEGLKIAVEASYIRSPQG